MSKKSKAKIEATPAPQSPSHEEEPARPSGPAAPPGRGWGWLRPEEVEPADEAKWDEATFDDSRWP